MRVNLGAMYFFKNSVEHCNCAIHLYIRDRTMGEAARSGSFTVMSTFLLTNS